MSVRVKVCLSKVFKDHRQAAFVYVDSRFDHVINLEEHIRRLFNIKSDIYLTIDGTLLPPQESINVVCSGDVIKVNKLSNEASNGTELSLIKADKKVPEHIIENELSDEINSPKRGKRVRKRKIKGANAVEAEIKEETIKDRTSELTFQSEKLLKQLSLAQTKKSSHIRFSNVDTVIDIEPIEPTTYNSSDILQPSARVIRPLTVLSDAEPAALPCNESPNSENSSLPDCKQRLIKLRDYANDTNFMNVAATMNFQEIKENIDNDKYFATLEEELKTYDVVGFKILKMNENYEPVLSDWIIALVKDVEELNVSMHLLAGKDETLGPSGKLSMDVCEEETETDEVVTMKRSEMLNVKIVLKDC